MTFSRQKILNSPPYFRYFNTFPPISKLLFPPYFSKFSPCFRKIYVFFTYFICFSFPPSLTMMHLCITQCTYWTPLLSVKLSIVLLRLIQRNSKALNCDASKLLRQLSSTCPPKVRTKSRPMCIFSLTEPVYPLV